MSRQSTILVVECGFKGGLGGVGDGGACDNQSRKFQKPRRDPCAAGPKTLNPATTLREHQKLTPHRARIATL